MISYKARLTKQITKRFAITKMNSLQSFKNCISEDYDLATIVHFLEQVYFVKNIDNLLVELVIPTSN
jgi:hypothetical protein